MVGPVAGMMGSIAGALRGVQRPSWAVRVLGLSLLAAALLTACGGSDRGDGLPPQQTAQDSAERSSSSKPGDTTDQPVELGADCPVDAAELSAIFNRELAPADLESNAPEIICNFEAVQDPTSDPGVLIIRSDESLAKAKETYESSPDVSVGSPQLVIINRSDLGNGAFALEDPEAGVGLTAFFPSGETTIAVLVGIGHDDAQQEEGHHLAERVIDLVHSRIG